MAVKQETLDKREDDELNEMAHRALVSSSDKLPVASEVGKSAYEQLRNTERRFVDEYIVTDDAIGAYVLSSKMASGQRSNVLRVRALEIIRRPLVQAAIRERQEYLRQKSDITAEAIIGEVAKMAFSNMINYGKVAEDGSFALDLTTTTTDQFAAIQEITTEENESESDGGKRSYSKRSKIKLHSKNDALDKLMRRFGLYAPDRHEFSGPGGKPIKVAQLSVNATVNEAGDMYAAMLNEDMSD